MVYNILLRIANGTTGRVVFNLVHARLISNLSIGDINDMQKKGKTAANCLQPARKGPEQSAQRTREGQAQCEPVCHHPCAKKQKKRIRALLQQTFTTAALLQVDSHANALSSQPSFAFAFPCGGAQHYHLGEEITWIQQQLTVLFSRH